MTKEQNELIDYLENLPKRGDVIFSEGFQPDDYSTALGRLRKSINGNEPTREPLSENKEVEDCKLNRQPTECSIYLHTKGGCTNCGHYQS